MTLKEYINKYKDPIYDHLNISYSKLSDLNGIEEYSHIVRLNISYTNIKNIEPLKHLKKLEVLNISDNLIEDLEPLLYLDNLRNLWIYNNPITNKNPIYHPYRYDSSSLGICYERLNEFKILLRNEKRKRLINLLDQ